VAIIIYAGSLRPGGGLTVVKNVIEAIASNKNDKIIVYTGASDASAALRPLFDKFPQVQEKKYFPNTGSGLRYLLAKLHFLGLTLFRRDDLLFSINYWIPCFCKQIVYHINLLNFQRNAGDSFGKKIKEFDAALACRLASVNLFESNFLLREAENYTGNKIRNAHLLYACVDNAFVNSDQSAQKLDAHIMVVSSIQAHKDNEVCVDLLSKLVADYPDTNWQLSFAGGQSVKQWDNLKALFDSRQLAGMVNFLGPVDKRQLSQMLNQSLCLVNPSRIESFCMVALEAMASRCPVIVTSETSMPESVGDAAIIVNAGNFNEFASAVYAFFTDGNLRNEYIERGENRAQKFSTSKFNQRLLELIDEI